MNNYQKTNVTLENLEEIRDYIYHLQNLAKRNNKTYVCNINNINILVGKVNLPSSPIPNFKEDMKNYYYNIYRTLLLGKLASHCYYDETQEYNKTKELIETDTAYDAEEYINIANQFNSERDHFDFCPMPYLKNQNERIFWAQEHAIKDKYSYYYNFDGIDLVALPNNNYKFNINLAQENSKQAEQKMYYLKRFENLNEEEFICG